MNLLTVVVIAQLAVPARVPPVLSFPEAGLDDVASYRGYQTRFYRDAVGNTVQIYLDGRDGRVVQLWADADDESLGFTAQNAAGRAVPLRWDAPDALVAGAAGRRTVEHRLIADRSVIRLGWFLMGSMRVERDFQYSGTQWKPFTTGSFPRPELEQFLAAIDALDAATRRSHLALLGAVDVGTVRARLRPTITTTSSDTAWIARVAQPALDGRDTLAMEFIADPRRVAATRTATGFTLRARAGGKVSFRVRMASSGRPLTPLARDEIFTSQFLTFLDSARGAGASAASSTAPAAIRARWLERQVRGVELLASHEKLMAGLPTYATYFGRDMLVTALMMRPIWRAEMSEFAIASALRKLGPHGDVSHEEALGGQAIREAASEYSALLGSRRDAVRRGDGHAADTLLTRATTVLRELRRVRENYHMIDDELQLPILVGRWLDDDRLSAAHKRAFLLDSSDGEPRLARLLRELALVSRMTAPYAARPVAENLVSFERRDTSWASASWRDSGTGYARGRFAMDVNAIWAPHALEALARILDGLRALDLPPDSLARLVPDVMASGPLAHYVRDPAALRAAVATWRGAERHFVVTLRSADVHDRVTARLAAMPAAERRYWATRMTATRADTADLSFLALSLDAAGHPIAVANTDPATRLFLGSSEGPVSPPDAGEAASVLRDVRLFARPYPVGLLVDRVGPAVVNDAYASPSAWRDFVRDTYHGPRVIWGREVNLFLLGAAHRIMAASANGPDGWQPRDASLAGYVTELRASLRAVRDAAEGSGFHAELWSYAVEHGRVVPVRYGSGADVQLWSTTDLAVQFVLSGLRP